LQYVRKNQGFRYPNYLECQLNYTAISIGAYRKTWRRVHFFMASNGYIIFTPEIEEELLWHHFKGQPKHKLGYKAVRSYNGIKMLFEYINTGKISMKMQPKKVAIALSGEIGHAIRNFLEYCKIEKGLSDITVDTYLRSLSKLCSYCETQGFTDIREIDFAFLLRFISQLDNTFKSSIECILSALRNFTKYLFNESVLNKDFSLTIPKYRTIDQAQLPSTYNKEEIELLLDSIERSSTSGKRNYAIVLLAAKLGLRASDICRLTFDDLSWETSTIKIRQHKTGKDLILPLLADVGNAIIDYLKYSRAISDEPYVFLMTKAPYGAVVTATITHIVQREFKKAGIDITNRKFGPHALRHSLSHRLLDEQIVLPVISEVLGHKNTESTKYYLRIDLQSMRQCMLDVPVVPSDFYRQKGDIFYG